MFLSFVLDQLGFQVGDVVMVKLDTDTDEALLKRPTVIDYFIFSCRRGSSIVCITVAWSGLVYDFELRSVLVYDCVLIKVPAADSFGHIAVLVGDAQLDLVFIHALKHVIFYGDPGGLLPFCI